MKLITRENWGAAPPTNIDRIHLPQREVWIHHTADAGPKRGKFASEASEASYLQAVQRYHMQTRGYADIGYSFIIMPSGRVYEGRGWGVEGAHTRGRNDRSHAICFAGTFVSKNPTRAARRACLRLIQRGMNAGKIVAPRIDGHRNAPDNQTSCPGDALMAFVPELRRAVRS